MSAALRVGDVAKVVKGRLVPIGTVGVITRIYYPKHYGGRVDQVADILTHDGSEIRVTLRFLVKAYDEPHKTNLEK